MKSKAICLILLLVFSAGCSSTLNNTIWESVDINEDGSLAMGKEITFTGSRYILLNKYISSGKIDTITGDYKLSSNKLVIRYDGSKRVDTALIRNDSLLLGEANKGYLIFKKLRK